MTTYTETFKRKEIKYRINAEQYERIKQGLAAYMEVDDYGATKIESLYYDTPARAIIERSLEKPYYKEKLRVRKYVGDGTGMMYVELKKKVNGIVYKRRVQMPASAAGAYMAGETYERAMIDALGKTPETMEKLAEKRQIAREIDAFKTRYPGLRESMVIGVVRTAWRAKADCAEADNLRITFDENPCYIDMMAGTPGYDQKAPRTGRLINPGEAIMEIKCLGAYPLWLVHLLTECQVYPTSFSKYGEAYRICTGTKKSIEEKQPNIDRAIA